MVLTENATLVAPDDLRGVVELARVAEGCGVHTVMLSEHVVLSTDSADDGLMTNPRDYAAPGNQHPHTPWPDTVVLASAIAHATTELRVALAAIITPLRHPLQLAKQLGPLDLLAGGRLAVQPTVRWSQGRYPALGGPLGRRRRRVAAAAKGQRLEGKRPLKRGIVVRVAMVRLAPLARHVVVASLAGLVEPLVLGRRQRGGRCLRRLTGQRQVPEGQGRPQQNGDDAQTHAPWPAAFVPTPMAPENALHRFVVASVVSGVRRLRPAQAQTLTCDRRQRGRTVCHRTPAAFDPWVRP